MPKPLSVLSGTFFGFDFGTKNIGVAVGQTVTDTANPLTTLKAQNGIPDWRQLDQLVEEWHPKGLVIGLSLQPDGTHSKTSLKALRFGEALKARFKLPIYTVEERLTSVAASHTLQQMRGFVSRHETQDAIAAVIILESWFNQLKLMKDPLEYDPCLPS